MTIADGISPIPAQALCGPPKLSAVSHCPSAKAYYQYQASRLGLGRQGLRESVLSEESAPESQRPAHDTALPPRRLKMGCAHGSH
eukprot:CAMPEP_0119424334 /NCGR_PEP_ID=MMETSP1335-20130426/32330_1 /TAXON_ID=259385 /ORGANISM="Chrysoculter rhomboideus, Strain RCC1486" /LENGTH=84 /DNA_ID=CAMNT_0007449853 /DNA_START=38 /DNA_END=292 /DNA_ORIENTATION=-